MARLNLRAVEERVAPLGGRDQYDREFIFELLLAYGRSKSSVTRLRNGSLNLAADKSRDILQKGIVYFRETDGDPLSELESIKNAPETVRFRPRFIIVTNYDELLAIDTKTRENLIIPIAQIDQYFTFFLPWAGMEKAQYTAEAHADARAAERMGELYDELLNVNPGLLETDSGRHGLNLFFTRLLFCFFAEDTEIFPPGLFTETIGSLSREDGSDTAELIREIFCVLDTKDEAEKPTHLRRFPYVNGRLFSVGDDDVVPQFSPRSRKLLTDLGKLQWQEINPDIFGSMFQAIAKDERRSELGQHYTSVPNILKTIEPLFLDELRDEFDRSADSVKKLKALLERISAIRIFDPACGSGNFLVIAYKELRRLEHAILEQIDSLENRLSKEHETLTIVADSRISIENFYGIEIDDFAVEVAILSLWIAKHQMNVEFREKFGVSIPLIPLRESGNVVVGNAARIDWNEVCPNNGEAEIYLIGNPPYAGAWRQQPELKDDYRFVFGDGAYPKSLDYVSLWFVKGSYYIKNTKAQIAFVSTNSVSQGQHVELLFPKIFEMGLEIGYVYTSFKWENNAKNNAGVTVVVINLRNPSSKPKLIFTDDISVPAENINGYLVDAPNVHARSRRAPISDVPKMTKGSQPTGKDLLLEPSVFDDLRKNYPLALSFVKRFTGAEEYINGKERYCIWVEEDELSRAREIPQLARRFELVKANRSASTKAATRKLADSAHRFAEIRYKPTDAIIVPSVSSERREYIPIGFVGPDTVISNLAFAVYDAEPWLFAILTSRMHMAWTRAVGGQLETRLRYSNTLVYNNFPMPDLTDADKARLDEVAFRVLDVREYHSEKTLAELYDPDHMPDNLREAHARVDELVDLLYRKAAFETDEERLSLLFEMYKKLTAEEGLKK